jgi:hypothetical protein
MLDGFVILQNIYPARLDYSYGMEHIEILLRPIPRALWPTKPGGGYMNKLHVFDTDTGTVGFSPTIFGDFYAEDGLVGIIVLSLLYGACIGLITKRATGLSVSGLLLVRAVLCASLIPLLRGGDLAGIYSWIGMSFWPCFLVLWKRRSELVNKEAAASAPMPRRTVRPPLSAPALR